MIPEPKSQKGLQNDQKSIMFIDKGYMAFCRVENLINPVEMKTFERPESQNLTWLAWPDPAWPAQAQPQPELQNFNFR